MAQLGYLSITVPGDTMGRPGRVEPCVCTECLEARKEWMMKKRMPVNKHKSAKKFRHNVSRTHPMNMKAAPMRGGIRL